MPVGIPVGGRRKKRRPKHQKPTDAPRITKSGPRGSTPGRRKATRSAFSDRLANVRAEATAAAASGGRRTLTKPTVAKSGQAQPYRKAQVGTAVKTRSRTAALSAMKRGKPRYSANPAASRNAATKRATAQRKKKRY